MNSDLLEGSKFCLLIVEDDLAEQNLLVNVLNRHFSDWEYYFVSNEIELIDFLKSGTPFSIMLLDINLPGRNGLEILRNIRQNELFKSIPIIGYSSETDQKKIFDILLSGATTFFKKPINTDELIGLLKTLPSYKSRL